MIKTVNQKGLRGTVWEYLVIPGHERALLVWCQWGTYCRENVGDVVETYGNSREKVRIIENEDEEADITSFIEGCLSTGKEGERLIIISVLPWGRAEADLMMERYSDSFESVRYQADVNEWLEAVSRRNNFNRPLLGFLKKYPEYFILPYGENPLPFAVGPCPNSWEDLDSMWSDIYYRSFYEWKTMTVHDKIRILLICVGTCIGSYEPMKRRLRAYLLLHRGYDDILLPPPPMFFDDCNHERSGDEKSTGGKARFINIINEKGELI